MIFSCKSPPPHRIFLHIHSSYAGINPLSICRITKDFSSVNTLRKVLIILKFPVIIGHIFVMIWRGFCSISVIFCIFIQQKSRSSLASATTFISYFHPIIICGRSSPTISSYKTFDSAYMANSNSCTLTARAAKRFH